MGKCDGVEGVCVRYARALGGNARVVAGGGGLGELRKEKVLPKRFGLVTGYQEKLRQVRLIHSLQITTR